MVSIILAIRDAVRELFPRIERMRRFPSAKIVRANYLGLALGFIATLAGSWLQYDFIYGSQQWYEVLLQIGLFAVGTYFLGGFFTIIVAASALILSLLSAAPPSGSLWCLSMWYLTGYAFGALFGLIYCDLVYLYLTIFKKRDTKIAFAYYPKRELNIVKSPSDYVDDDDNNATATDREQRTPLYELIIEDPALKDRRVYDFELDAAPPKPYTILFVANPGVRLKRSSETEAYRFAQDPIISNRDLFYQSVDRALHAFEHDEVLGNEQIWSRVRVITIFDEKRAKEFALVEEFQGVADIDGDSPNNLLDPLQEMTAQVQQMLDGYSPRFSIEDGDIDVIFALSAHPTHDRCMAHWSDFDEKDQIVTSAKAGGRAFSYNPNPSSVQDKAGTIRVITTFQNNGSIGKADFEHEHYVKSPGRVALNVLGANARTYLHEFAHAMSSVKNGAIMDEYADIMILKPNNRAPNPRHPFYVNRIERELPVLNGGFRPIHKIFADYNGAVFHSDLHHPSTEENWLNYFPERPDAHIGCTMDRYRGRYRFDKLISNFVYDRITAKLNRPA